MIPPSVTEANIPTNPVSILDVGLYLPAMLITPVLPGRKNLLGFLLAGPLLVFSVLMGTAILSIFLVMGSQGIATSVGIKAFFRIIIMVNLVLSVIYILEIPLTIGIDSTLIAPWPAAIGAVGTLLTHCTVELVRTNNPDETSMM